MVLGFCGRMRAGKTTLADECEKRGYIRLSFATPLKRLCADLLDCSVDALNEAKNKGANISLPLGSDIQDCLSIETGIPIEQVNKVCEGQVMETVRELLQFVGTELIRQYCPTWHIDRTREMMSPRQNYVIDDVRFQNEKQMIESMGGHCWFVVRPGIDNLSSHPSETSIKWQDCSKKVIVNNGSENELKLMWKLFLDEYEENFVKREKVFQDIINEGRMISNEKRELAELLLISHYLFTYTPPVLGGEITDVNFSEDGVLKIKVNGEDKTSFITQNPLEIEDIKFLLTK